MTFKISDIEVGDYVLVKAFPKSKWFYVNEENYRYLTYNDSLYNYVVDVCKQNKDAQQDIISRAVKNFDLALANEVNSRIDSFLNNIKENI